MPRRREMERCACGSRSRRAAMRSPRTRRRRCCASSSSPCRSRPRHRNASTCSTRATARSTCCGARPTGCRVSQSWRRSQTRSAMRASRSTCACDARRHCAPEKTSSARRSSRARCETSRSNGTIQRASWGAYMELGQDLLRAAAGESFTPAEKEVDLDGAEAAFRRAIELAEPAGDDARLASALRELGVVLLGRIRSWFVEQVELGQHLPIARRVAQGEPLDQIAQELSIAPIIYEAATLLQRALGLFEQQGDRRGAMSTIIALACLSWAPDIHLGTNSGWHIEEIRRLTSKLKTMTNESERAVFEAQMLYGAHVFARAKVIPDVALRKGEEAYRYAGDIGDPALQFLAAGGTAMAHLDLGEVDDACTWIDRAAAVASEHPSPYRARRLETWRGMADAMKGDATGMRTHLERAVQQATDTGQAAVRCEALARLAVEASRLGSRSGDADLIALTHEAAAEASRLAEELPGHPPWGAQANAARARAAFARGSADDAGAFALAAGEALEQARHEDLQLEVLLPVARVLKDTGSPAWETRIQPHVQVALAMVAQRTVDEDVRVRWLRGPYGAEMADLAGPLEGPATDGEQPETVTDDQRLLQSLVQGKTNREIADELGADEATVARRLGELFATIGVSSRADATAFAFREHVL